MLSPKVVTVEVTQEDIEQGKPRSSCNCPIALAAKRALSAPRATVGCSGAIYDTPESYDLSRHYAPIGIKAWEFIADFDGGRPVQPFTFTAELVEF